MRRQTAQAEASSGGDDSGLDPKLIPGKHIREVIGEDRYVVSFFVPTHPLGVAVVGFFLEIGNLDTVF